MFNLELDAHEVLQLGKILIDAGVKGDDSEAIDLYHRLVATIKKGK